MRCDWEKIFEIYDSKFQVWNKRDIRISGKWIFEPCRVVDRLIFPFKELHLIMEIMNIVKRDPIIYFTSAGYLKASKGIIPINFWCQVHSNPRRVSAVQVGLSHIGILRFWKLVRPVYVTLAYSVSTCIAFNYILNFYFLPFAVEITWSVKLLRSNSPNPAKKGLICSGRDKNWSISTKSRPESIPSERFSYFKSDSAKQAYYKGLRVVDRNREFLPSKYFYRRKEYRELRLVLDRNFHRRKV